MSPTSYQTAPSRDNLHILYQVFLWLNRRSCTPFVYFGLRARRATRLLHPATTYTFHIEPFFGLNRRSCTPFVCFGLRARRATRLLHPATTLSLVSIEVYPSKLRMRILGVVLIFVKKINELKEHSLKTYIKLKLFLSWASTECILVVRYCNPNNNNKDIYEYCFYYANHCGDTAVAESVK